MYEDAEIERAAFPAGGRVFCIASAGSTPFALAERCKVVACDVNPVQLEYARRRAQGGPVEIGEAERFMNLARAFSSFVGWKESMLREFMALSDVNQQADFWRTYLDTRRFRAGFDLLMSRALLRLGYSERFLSFLPPSFGSVLRKRLARGFARHPNASNPFAHLLLLGECHEPKWNTPQVRFELGDAAEFLESCPPGTFDGFTLSNILDGADARYRARLAAAVRRVATEDAAIVLRSFAEPEPDLKVNYAERDRAMLWGVVEVRSAESLEWVNGSGVRASDQNSIPSPRAGSVNQ